jgi:hypothetical protein
MREEILPLWGGLCHRTTQLKILSYQFNCCSQKEGQKPSKSKETILHHFTQSKKNIGNTHTKAMTKKKKKESNRLKLFPTLCKQETIFSPYRIIKIIYKKKIPGLQYNMLTRIPIWNSKCGTL